MTDGPYNLELSAWQRSKDATRRIVAKAGGGGQSPVGPPAPPAVDTSEAVRRLLGETQIFCPTPEQAAQANAKAPGLADVSGHVQVIHGHAHSPDGCPRGCAMTRVFPRVLP